MPFRFFAERLTDRLERLIERLAQADNQTVDFTPGDPVDAGGDRGVFRPARNESDLRQGDTLDLSGLGAGARVDLDINNQGVLAGVVNRGLTEDGRVSVDGIDTAVTDFENVIGTDFDDTIFGNAQNNVLLGGAGDDAIHPFAGNDFVDGGAGTDTLLLQGFASGSRVDLERGISRFLDGTPGVNRFVDIENVNGSSVAGDLVIGNLDDNLIRGFGGEDTLFGGGGDDTLVGDGDGDPQPREGVEIEGVDDILVGGRGFDTVTGGAGRDSFGFAEGDGAGAAGLDEITDFTIEDRFVLDAESFGVEGDLEVQTLTAVDGALSGVDLEATVYVVQGIGGAIGVANALAEATGEAGDGLSKFFIYFNTGQNRNRLFEIDDLSEGAGAGNANITQIANLGDGSGDTQAGLDLLGALSEENFSFQFDDLLG